MRLSEGILPAFARSDSNRALSASNSARSDALFTVAIYQQGCPAHHQRRSSIRKRKIR